MSIRNRELSQFGSFIYIDDSTKTVGIATTSTPYVGIGTTNATSKLTVVGDTNIVGVLSATSYYLNGNPLVDAATDKWPSGTGNDIYRQLGNVGIGSTIPRSRLDVNGNINISGITTSSTFSSTVATGTAPFTVSSTTLVSNLNASLLGGKTPPSGDIVGHTDSQALTNKTINLASNTLTGTLAQFNTALSDGDFVTIAGIQTLTNKTLTTPIISAISNSGTQTVPTGTGTLVSTNSVGIITNGMIADGAITNIDIASDAAIAISKLAASTISSISLGNNLNNLTAGSFINYSSGSTYNGSSAVTVSVAGTTANTANTLIARNGSGDFSAGSITCANLTAGFTVQAADFNSTSDENLKTNIETVQNPLDTLQQLRGVTFDWKSTNKSSVGVIAQELEQVLPQLVNEGEHKSVNYNGLIGVLIEAVKELSAEVEELKSKLNN